MRKFSSPLLLFLAVLVIVITANSWKVFNYPPYSVHQWRQSDCAAYVKTYYRNNTGLFEPATFYLGGTQGRVVSEFPIIYYVAAKIEKIAGEHYWITRGLTFICYLIGLFSLLGSIRNWISVSTYLLFPIVLIASSPYYYYYAINFLPNIPAISFSFVGLYFFLRYEQTKKNLALIFGTLCFILATALKPTDGGIIWLAYLSTWASSNLFKKNIIEKIKVERPILVSSILIVISIVSWILFVNWYNDKNGNHQNLVGIYPVWSMDKDLFNYTRSRIGSQWSHVFQQRIILWFLLGCFLVYLFKWRSLNPFLKTFSAFLIFGVLLYSVLWFKAFNDHDYYQLTFVLPAVFLIVTVLEYYVRILKPRLSFFANYIITGVMILLVIISIYHNRNVQRNRYSDNSERVVIPVFFEIEPYLRSIGVRSSDTVVCVPDKSPNTSLNAINNYGYTEVFNDSIYNINYFQSHGASYLIVGDSGYLVNPLYKPFTKKQIGYYKGVYVFDIKMIIKFNSKLFKHFTLFNN